MLSIEILRFPTCLLVGVGLTFKGGDSKIFGVQELWNGWWRFLLLALIDLQGWIEELAYNYGYFGIFLVSFIGSVSIIFPIPYTIIIFMMGQLLEPSLLAVAGGLGSALGEFSGYVLGYYGRAVVNEKRRRKMDYMLKVFNRYGSITIFLFALTPLPDDLLFIPLGMMRYGFLKAFIPSFAGKFLMCFILAYGGRKSIEIVRKYLGESGGMWTTVITTLLLVVVLFAILRIDWEKIFFRYIERREGGKEGLDDSSEPSDS